MLALTLVEVGDYGAAIRHATLALEKSKKVGAPTIMRVALLSWVIVHRTVMAIDVTREKRPTLLETVSKPTKDWILGELSVLSALSGDWVQAHDYARQAVALRVAAALPPIGCTGWYETEALLRGGDGDLARAEVERLATVVGANRRYRLPLLRSQAVLAQAITHLQAALALAREIGLPGEAWPILGALDRLYAEQGDQAMAQQAYKDAAVIIHRLAETIDEEELRVGYLTAVPVRAVLAMSEMV